MATYLVVRTVVGRWMDIQTLMRQEITYLLVPLLALIEIKSRMIDWRKLTSKMPNRQEFLVFTTSQLNNG